MIPRYSRPEMVSIWSQETKFRIWFEIEAHACFALADLGVIPKEAAQNIWDKGSAAEFDVAKIDEIEAVTKHDVIAFLTHLAEFIGPDSRFVHQGMTSSDVLDTTFNIQLVRAADILIADMDKVLAALKKRAFEHKDTVRIGRSHGIHAEPTTMGLTFARFYAEMSRNRDRLVAARAEVATGAISGAVGTFANIDPSVEEHVCEKLGLKPEPISTQVIRATVMPCSSRRLASLPLRSKTSPLKSATCSARKFWKRKSSSRPARRVRPPCRTSAIRC